MLNLNSGPPMTEARNAGYVTSGYNVIKGNPASVDKATGIDPGFLLNPIFAYELSDMGNYSGYYQPDGYYIVPSDTC